MSGTHLKEPMQIVALIAKNGVILSVREADSRRTHGLADA
jgi:hypothetical protein